jgi:glycosyltransferase involved in cell wall biosynthesis
MFSIIIPLYNKVNHIAETISSVLHQSFERFELIVVDNNSSDNGVEIVQQMHDPRIVLHQEKNQGVSFARNKGVLLAKYDWICFLDADDSWEKDQLLNFKININQHANLAVFANNYKIADLQGKERICERNHLHYKGSIYALPCFFKDYSESDMPVNMNSVCIHKNVFDQIGGFDVRFKNGEDTLFWMKLFLKNQVFISDYVGSTYNLKATNRSNSLSAFSIELPVIKEFESVFLCEPILHAHQNSFNAFIAKHLFVSLMANIKLGKLQLARSFFFDKRVYSLPQKLTLLTAFMLSFTPLFLSRFLMRLLQKVGLIH